MRLSFDRVVHYLSDDKFNVNTGLDEKFITHRPTSFFVLDPSIPRKIRELVAESEKCLQFNAPTGASAVLRKAIYTLLKKKENCLIYEEILEEMYAEPARRKARKEKLNEINSAFGSTKNGNHNTSTIGKKASQSV